MKLYRSLPLALALGMALAGCSGSSSSDSSKKLTNTPANKLEAAQKLVTGASRGQAKAERVFEGQDGMTGIVISSANGQSAEQAVGWMSPNGQVLFLGPALNATGENLNNTLGQEPSDSAAVSDSPTVNMSALLERSASSDTGSFIHGSKGPIVTAIVDLNCSHCNTFFSSTQPLINSGKLRVRYVLAGFLSSTSLPKAAAVLGAKDKVAAMAKAEADFAKNGQRGPAPNFNPEFEATVKANNDILRLTGEPATPYLIYCDKESQTVKGQAGAPVDLETFVNNLDSNPHPNCSK